MTTLLPILAQDYNYEPSSGSLIGGLIALVLYVGLVILFIASKWKLFTKAGKPGWAAIVPVYDVIVLLEIVGRPLWWLVLVVFLPFIMVFVLAIDIAKSFGKSAGFGIALVFLFIILLPMLAFGSARYHGPAAAA